MSVEDRDDDLFTPSLKGVRRDSLPGTARPWRLSSQFYVAFFGGPLAAAAIAWLNGGRLGLSDARRLAIAGIGAAGLLVTLLLMVAIDPATDGSIRLVVIVVGVVCYLATRELQKPADRVYAAGRDQAAYASLWLRGIATALVCGVATGVAVAAAASA